MEYTLLRAFLSPEVHDGGEAGWEEHTEAAMTQLLRTCLAKNAKEAAVVLAPLTACKDTSKLKKHILLVLERLARGMKLSAGAAGGGGGGSAGGGDGAQRDGERSRSGGVGQEVAAVGGTEQSVSSRRGGRESDGGSFDGGRPRSQSGVVSPLRGSASGEGGGQ